LKKHVKNFLADRGLSGYEPYACEKCGRGVMESRELDVHHVRHKGIGGSKLLDGADNLIGLCRKCHNEEHGLG